MCQTLAIRLQQPHVWAKEQWNAISDSKRSVCERIIRIATAAFLGLATLFTFALNLLGRLFAICSPSRTTETPISAIPPDRSPRAPRIERSAPISTDDAHPASPRPQSPEQLIASVREAAVSSAPPGSQWSEPPIVAVRDERPVVLPVSPRPSFPAHRGEPPTALVPTNDVPLTPPRLQSVAQRIDSRQSKEIPSVEVMKERAQKILHGARLIDCVPFAQELELCPKETVTQVVETLFAERRNPKYATTAQFLFCALIQNEGNVVREVIQTFSRLFKNPNEPFSNYDLLVIATLFQSHPEKIGYEIHSSLRQLSFESERRVFCLLKQPILESTLPDWIIYTLGDILTKLLEPQQESAITLEALGQEVGLSDSKELAEVMFQIAKQGLNDPSVLGLFSSSKIFEVLLKERYFQERIADSLADCLKKEIPLRDLFYQGKVTFLFILLPPEQIQEHLPLLVGKARELLLSEKHYASGYEVLSHFAKNKTVREILPEIISETQTSPIHNVVKYGKRLTADLCMRKAEAGDPLSAMEFAQAISSFDKDFFEKYECRSEASLMSSFCCYLEKRPDEVESVVEWLFTARIQCHYAYELIRHIVIEKNQKSIDALVRKFGSLLISDEPINQKDPWIIETLFRARADQMNVFAKQAIETQDSVPKKIRFFTLLSQTSTFSWISGVSVKVLEARERIAAEGLQFLDQDFYRTASQFLQDRIDRYDPYFHREFPIADQAFQGAVKAIQTGHEFLQKEAFIVLKMIANKKLLPKEITEYVIGLLGSSAMSKRQALELTRGIWDTREPLCSEEWLKEVLPKLLPVAEELFLQGSQEEAECAYWFLRCLPLRKSVWIKELIRPIIQKGENSPNEFVKQWVEVLNSDLRS